MGQALKALGRIFGFSGKERKANGLLQVAPSVGRIAEVLKECVQGEGPGSIRNEGDEETTCSSRIEGDGEVGKEWDVEEEEEEKEGTVIYPRPRWNG